MRWKYVVILTLLMDVSLSYAADFRGRLTGIGGAQLNVYCGGFHKSKTLPSSGNFNVTGLPAKKSCYFIVSDNGSASVNMPFNSNNNVTVYNGKLKRLKGNLLVIRN